MYVYIYTRMFTVEYALYVAYIFAYIKTIERCNKNIKKQLPEGRESERIEIVRDHRECQPWWSSG